MGDLRWNYKQLELYTGRHWTWQLHENQSYVGRTILRLARPTIESLASCTDDEWQALRHELRVYEHILNKLFSPDRFNYCQLGNIFEQMHVHAIPRYKAPRNWKGYEFIDARWGKNWPPAPKSPLDRRETYAFAEWFREQINSFKFSANDLRGRHVG